MNIHYEMLGPDKVILALTDFEDLIDALAYDTAKAKQEESFPSSIAEQLLLGESPVRVFREYRGMTQMVLAEKAGVSQALIAEIESGRKTGSVETVKSLAAALGVGLDDLV